MCGKHPPGDYSHISIPPHSWISSSSVSRLWSVTPFRLSLFFFFFKWLPLELMEVGFFPPRCSDRLHASWGSIQRCKPWKRCQGLVPETWKKNPEVKSISLPPFRSEDAPEYQHSEWKDPEENRSETLTERTFDRRRRFIPRLKGVSCSCSGVRRLWHRVHRCWATVAVGDGMNFGGTSLRARRLFNYSSLDDFTPGFFSTALDFLSGWNWIWLADLLRRC